MPSKIFSLPDYEKTLHQLQIVPSKTKYSLIFNYLSFQIKSQHSKAKLQFKIITLLCTPIPQLINNLESPMIE